VREASGPLSGMVIRPRSFAPCRLPDDRRMGVQNNRSDSMYEEHEDEGMPA
jgi:hypothetical protein